VATTTAPFGGDGLHTLLKLKRMRNTPHPNPPPLGERGPGKYQVYGAAQYKKISIGNSSTDWQSS